MSQTNLPNPIQQPINPLTEDEKRQILLQLYELRAARAEIAAYVEYIERDKEADAREKQNYEESLKLAQQRLDLQVKETELANERANMYKQMYEVATKKPGGVKHTLCKVFTLGLARCQ